MKDRIDRMLANIERLLYVTIVIIFSVMAFAQIFILRTDITVTLIFCFMFAVGVWAYKNKDK